MGHFLSSTYLARAKDLTCVLFDEEGETFSLVGAEEMATALFTRALGWFDSCGRNIAETLALRSMSDSLADLIASSHKEIADDAISASAHLGLSYYQALWLYTVGVGALRDRLGDLALHEVGASCRAHYRSIFGPPRYGETWAVGMHIASAAAVARHGCISSRTAAISGPIRASARARHGVIVLRNKQRGFGHGQSRALARWDAATA